MSRRWRVILAVVGLLVACLSLAALVYALTPVDKTREQYRPEPTLFSPPLSYRWDEPVCRDLSGARFGAPGLSGRLGAHLTGPVSPPLAATAPFTGLRTFSPADYGWASVRLCAAVNHRAQGTKPAQAGSFPRPGLILSGAATAAQTASGVGGGPA